jgi:membrane-associated phospholipid phosphatase
LLICGLLASLLGVVVAGDNVLDADVTILRAIQEVDLPVVDVFVTVANLAFSTGGGALLAVVAISAAYLLHRPGLMLQVAIVVVLRLIGQVLKPVFDSPRPGVAHQSDPSQVWHTLGYPSGHAYTAAIVTSMVMIVTRSLDVPRTVQIVTNIAAVLVAALALVARIHIGAHWPSDAIGGFLYGIATVSLMQVIVGRWWGRPGR